MQIMTGGLIPKDFDAIIPNEKINYYPNKKKAKYILINERIRKNENVRLRGSDFKKNDLILSKGTLIQPKHILALRGLGVKRVNVKRIPRILFFSSGNEISDNKKIPQWKVRNSNSDYIKSLEYNYLFNFKYGGILRDKDNLKFQKKIKKTLNSNIDIIITSGAVSAGKYDFIPNIIKKFRLSNFFKGAYIRPGKPILFAKFKGKQKSFFGLPGNPISSAACFRFFVYPYLQNILGLKKEVSIKGRLKNSFIKKKFFTHFMKSKIYTTKDGMIKIEILKGQESFKIKSFIKSNMWTLLPAGKSKFKKDEIVECFLPNYPNKFFY